MPADSCGIGTSFLLAVPLEFPERQKNPACPTSSGQIRPLFRVASWPPSPFSCANAGVQQIRLWWPKAVSKLTLTFSKPYASGSAWMHNHCNIQCFLFVFFAGTLETYLTDELKDLMPVRYPASAIVLIMQKKNVCQYCLVDTIYAQCRRSLLQVLV